MSSSLNGTGLTFSSGQTLNALPVTSFVGQTGAVDPTTLGAIGCFMTVQVLSTSAYSPNATIAGSSLFYPNTQSYIASQGSYFIWFSDTSNLVELTMAGGRDWSIPTKISYRRYNAGNPGAVVPPNCTALSGTWRILSMIPAGYYSYDSSYRTYDSGWYTALAVRIA